MPVAELTRSAGGGAFGPPRIISRATSFTADVHGRGSVRIDIDDKLQLRMGGVRTDKPVVLTREKGLFAPVKALIPIDEHDLSMLKDLRKYSAYDTMNTIWQREVARRRLEPPIPAVTRIVNAITDFVVM